MITGELKNKIDSLWDVFAAGGLVNPLDVIEQITYLMFIRDLDDSDKLREKEASMLGLPFQSICFAITYRFAVLLPPFASPLVTPERRMSNASCSTRGQVFPTGSPSTHPIQLATLIPQCLVAGDAIPCISALRLLAELHRSLWASSFNRKPNSWQETVNGLHDRTYMRSPHLLAPTSAHMYATYLLLLLRRVHSSNPIKVQSPFLGGKPARQGRARHGKYVGAGS